MRLLVPSAHQGLLRVGEVMWELLPPFSYLLHFAGLLLYTGLLSFSFTFTKCYSPRFLSL